MNEDLVSKIPVAAFAVAATSAAAVAAPPPPPPIPRTLRPAPRKEPAREPVPARETKPPLAPYFPTPAAATADAGNAGMRVSAREVAAGRGAGSGPVWTFWQLGLVGVIAWIVPIFLTLEMAGNFEGRGMLDAALAIQVAGYLVGGLAVTLLVARYHAGNWDSVGLHPTRGTVEDLFRGFGLGLVLIGSFIGGVYLVTQRLDVDHMVRSLVGATTGPGFVIGALVVVVGAPVMEEIYFRGMLFNRARRESGFGGAVGVTTVLFVLAHGSGLLDPPRFLFGLSAGLARKTKSVWFTIGAHAAWNGVIVLLGVFLLTGPAHVFTAADGSFTMRHPAKWDRMEEVETGQLELVLTTPAGAFIGVGRNELPPGWNRSNVGDMLRQNQATLPLPPGISMGPMRESNLVEGGLTKTFETSMEISDPVLGEGRARMVAVARDGSTKLMLAVMACPVPECPAAEADFDAMLRSVQFAG